MNFYTKVFTKVGIGNDLKLSVTVASTPQGGLSLQKLEEIKGALRERGLDDKIEGSGQ